jgi:glyoxylase-like metal-dependent hydrolase (beta-lactamase superfamily II)
MRAAMLVPLQDNLYRLDTPFGGLPLSLYVITGSQTVLIDSGIATTPAEFIFPALDAAGLTPDLLICTHGHVDHFGGNSALQTRYPNMKIALQEDDALWAEDHERHFHEMYMCMPQTWQESDARGFLDLCGGNTAVDLLLRDGQVLDFSSFRFTLIHTRGHSPGHLTLHDAARGVAICGDVALGWGALAPGAPKINPYYYDADLYAQGIETVAGLEADLYCTGHAGSLDRQGFGRLASLSLDLVRSLSDWTFAALQPSEPRSLGQVARAVLPHLPGYEIGFHLHASVQAHLTKFCREGRARAVMVDGLKHYLKVA